MREAVTVLVLALLLPACGSQAASTTVATTPQAASTTVATTPQPAPAVELTASDKQVWAPLPPDRSSIPVLLYHGIGEPSDFADPADASYGVTAEDFAKQMTLLHYAGYRTVSLDTFTRFVKGEHVDLPAHPLPLTFDDGRLDSWTGGDAILQQLGYTVVLFVDVGRVESGDPHYLTMKELASLQASGRWNIQLHSGHGHTYIHYRPGPNGYGAYYAYEDSHESFMDWQQRAFGDIAWGRDQLTAHVPGYHPVAFAPPFGNYGQDGTNDRSIPRTLLTWLASHFADVFTQDVSPFAVPHAKQPLGRIQVTSATTGGELHSLLNP
jgi:peptidoglycan/xylan/chitin deacetylase (PgdA/CDA1 family)